MHWLCNKHWFPTGTELVLTKHGSVDKEVIVKVVKHIDKDAQNTVPESECILFLRDGRSSKQGDAWLEEWEKLRILMVKIAC